MQTLKFASAMAVGLLSAAAASAATVTLDFNGTTSFSSVADFYNGGTDGGGASGTNYGASFTGSVLSIANDSLGPYFANAPTTSVIGVNANDVPGRMNFAAGFSGALGLTYSSNTAPTIVNIYSGLNDTGTLLASFSLAVNSSGCATTQFCTWTSVTQNFAGTAESIDFTSNAGNALFTNLSVTPVPLPPSVLLMAVGAAGLGIFGVRRRAA